MTISATDLIHSLNKAYRLIKPKRSDLDNFKNQLMKLLANIDEKESEENLKIHLMDFFKNTFYDSDYLVATKGRTDFVVHLGKDALTPAGVLFEVKKPSNKTDMVSRKDMNKKAMRELILYYLRERINHKNNSITHLVITNIYEWYVFDAIHFEKIFTEDTSFKKAYKEWDAGQKVSTKTDLFYNEIARPFLDALDKELQYTHFDIRNYERILKKGGGSDDRKLIPLYKFFTPPHLLKLPFINDSNALDKNFFAELLYIIGLKEFKDGSRKVINRLDASERQPASLIENTMEVLEAEEVLRKVSPKLYGTSKEEQLYAIALELCITWINRILFLKLLESQLLRYHDGEKIYKFLNINTIVDYDELNKLFFQVLARQNDSRTAAIKKKYGHIPYLNSSLFEISELEDITIRINSLDHNLTIDFYQGSVLKKGNDRKNTSSIGTLQYLFEFLDAYDFSSVGKEDIQEENKTIINAAVLGLVFEKINGYKDGSIYTPGAITMFLCQEAIRKAVVKKFNDAYKWQCENIDDIKNYLADKRNAKDILEFNQVIESIRIADPAVGSGHFLVSSLNELITIKAELGILADEKGHRLSDIDVSIANDELVIVDRKTQNFFEYTVGKDSTGHNVISPGLQHIQQSLFNEKRKIIEGCLFGVDINPNSVKICQLRLWIELLKHAYYRPETGFTELETLPNIDINIKCGNSLLSKYSLSEDLSEVFKKNKFGVKDYQKAVTDYKEAPNKDKKIELQHFFKTIKDQFHQTVAQRDLRRKKMSEIRGQLAKIKNNYDLFGRKRTEKQLKADTSKLEAALQKLEREICEIENNAVYRNAFEWRFEFPEIMDEKGEFSGFEVVIGNPPYIQLQKMGESTDVLEKQDYKTFTRTGDIYCLFYELATRLLKPGYYLAFITSNKWMRANYGQPLREFFIKETNPLLLVDFGGYQVFDAATVDTNMLISQKAEYQLYTKTCLLNKSLSSLEKMSDYIRQNTTSQCGFRSESGWVVLNGIEARIKAKIEAVGVPLKDWDVQIYRGILTGFNEAFIIDQETRDRLVKASPKNAEIIRPILLGKHIKRYKHQWEGNWIINAHNGQRERQVPRIDVENDYSEVFSHLKEFLPRIEERYDQGDHWSNLRNCAYLEEFEKPKIVWGNLGLNAQFSFIKEPIIINAPSPFFVTDNLYLLAVLNSKIADFYIKTLGVSRNGGYFEYKPMFVEQMPIPKVPAVMEERFSAAVKAILNSKTGTKIELEILIDQMVCDLFGLSSDERALLKLDSSIMFI